MDSIKNIKRKFIETKVSELDQFIREYAQDERTGVIYLVDSAKKKKQA